MIRQPLTTVGLTPSLLFSFPFSPLPGLATEAEPWPAGQQLTASRGPKGESEGKANLMESMLLVDVMAFLEHVTDNHRHAWRTTGEQCLSLNASNNVGGTRHTVRCVSAMEGLRPPAVWPLQRRLQGLVFDAWQRLAKVSNRCYLRGAFIPLPCPFLCCRTLLITRGL